MSIRYFFDFDLNGARTEDQIGVALLDDDIARVEALKALCASAMEDAVLALPLLGQEWRSSVEVRRGDLPAIFKFALTLAAE